jgi:hypothetical protein
LTDLTFVHLSDTHLGTEGERPFGTDTAGNLRAVAARIRDMGVQPAFFVLSGDVSVDGSEASYHFAKRLLDEELGPFGVPVLLTPGNHDLRLPFRHVLLGQAATDEQEKAPTSQEISGLRVVVLDSHVPGAEHGELGAVQLAWLERELARPAERGHLVVVHHPSAGKGLPSPDDSMLVDGPALGAVLARHPSVLGMLCGHVHLSGVTTFAGTLHVTVPAVAYLLDPSVQDGSRGLEGAGFNLCAVRDGALVVHPILLPGAQRELMRSYRAMKEYTGGAGAAPRGLRGRSGGHAPALRDRGGGGRRLGAAQADDAALVGSQGEAGWAEALAGTGRVGAQQHLAGRASVQIQRARGGAEVEGHDDLVAGMGAGEHQAILGGARDREGVIAADAECGCGTAEG